MAQEYRIDVAVDPSKAISGGKRVEQQLNSMGSAAERLRATLTRVFAVLGGGIAFRNFAKGVADYQKSIAEVSTLVNTATFDIQALNKAALANARLFGSPPITQTKAFYQAISAGAGTAADAINIVNVANKLAVGGVTDVATATDGLTSIINAYGLEASQAASISDAMFVGMRAGKTTIEELSRSMGRVAPIAASLGVDFDTLVAAVSALTKGGISTKESVTGVRAILAAVAKPTAEASKVAKSLGIEFNAAGLEALGLGGFLEMLVEATGGNVDQMAKLFGGVEALVPVMALAGQAGIDMANIQSDLANKFGETDKANEKLANTLSHQFGRVLQGLKATLLETGGALSGLIPLLKALADNMRIATDAVTSLGVAMLVAFSPRIIVAAINSIIAALRRLTAAALANPYTAIAAAIAIVISLIYTFRNQIADIQIQGVKVGVIWAYIVDRIKAAIDFFREGWRTAFSDVDGGWGYFLSRSVEGIKLLAGVIKDILNLIVGHFRASFLIWEFIFTEVPGIVRNAFNKAVNRVQEALENIVHAVGAGIDQIRKLWNTVANAVIDAFNAGIDAINNLNGGVKDFIIKVVGLFEDFLGAVDRIWSGIANIGITAANEVLGAWNSVVEKIKEAIRLPLTGAAERNLTRALGEDRAAGLIGNSAGLQAEYARLEARHADALERAGGPRGLNLRALRGRNDPVVRELGQIVKEMVAVKGLMDLTVASDKRRESYQIPLVDSLGIANKNLLKLDDNDQLQLNRLDNIAFEGGTFDNFGFNRLPESDAGRQTLMDFLRSIGDQYQRDYIGEGGSALLNNASNFNALRASHAFDEQFGAPQTITQDQADAAQPYIDKLSEIIAKQDEIDESTKSFGEQATDTFLNLGRAIRDGVADSIAQALVYSRDLKESLLNVARQAVAEFLSGLIKIGIQLGVNALRSHILQAQAVGTTSAAMTAIAAASAPAAALTSLATGGTNAVGANTALTSTVATAKGLAAFRDGADYIRGAGSSISDSILARLSVGEGVVSAAANRRNPGAVAAMNAGGVVGGNEMPEISLTVNVEQYPGVEVEVERTSETDVRIIAREEASRAVTDQAPKLIASEIARPNSAVSRQLRASGSYEPRAR